jgi:hypothetical protein
MRRTAWLVVLGIFVVAMLVSLGAAAAGQPAPKYVELKGRDIPEHSVWRGLFYELANAQAHDRDLDYLKNHLFAALTPEELDVLLKEAAKQPQRDAECERGGKERHAALVAAETAPDQLQAAEQVWIVECRHRTLDARDRVLAALSPDSQVVVSDWVANRRQTMTSYVTEGEVEQFRQPIR